MSTLTTRVLADRSTWTAIHWLGLVVAIALAAVHIAVGLRVGESPLIVIGISFVVAAGVFCTRWWRPVMYLLGVIHVISLGVIWVLSGFRYFEWGVLTALLGVALIVVALTLYVRESQAIN